MKETLIKELNIASECRASRLRWWQCPPVLVIIWGTVTIISLVATYQLASRYAEEEVVVISVTSVSIIFLTIGALIINGFNRIAEANRMKSEFISIASHQLRSPLSIFKWTLDMVEHDIAKGVGVAAFENALPTLRDTAENMIKLVNSILAVSRIEARTLKLKQEEISLSDLTEHIVNDFRKYAEASQLTLALNAPHDLPTIFADKEQVEMVIFNLMDNAIRYTSGAGAITIAICQKNQDLEWSIKDSGLGIPRTQQKYVFQKFFRAENGSQHQTHGTGIGLYIAKAIIEASGGKIGFTSEEKKGSTFWFTIPMALRNG